MIHYLWDQKSVKEAFTATCLVAAEKYDIDAEKLEKSLLGKRQGYFILDMIRILLHR